MIEVVIKHPPLTSMSILLYPIFFYFEENNRFFLIDLTLFVHYDKIISG